MTAAPVRRPRGITPARPSSAAAPSVAPGLTREWPLPFVLDVPLVLSVHRRGPRDPAYATDASGGIWRTSLTPEGPGTLRVTTRRQPVTDRTGPPGDAPPGRVTGQAWGPGAGWLLGRLPAWLGFHDDRAGFAARHPVVGELALRYEGFRVGRSGRVFEALVPAVLEQKVVSAEAHRAWPRRRRAGLGARRRLAA